MKEAQRRRWPPLPPHALERGGGLVLIVEPDPRPGFSGCMNVARIYWNGRRYRVPRAWRRFL